MKEICINCNCGPEKSALIKHSKDGRDFYTHFNEAACMYAQKHEIMRLREEVDKYDKVCTEVRNVLTDAGVPELTENRLSVIPLADRVRMSLSEDKKT